VSKGKGCANVNASKQSGEVHKKTGLIARQKRLRNAGTIDQATIDSVAGPTIAIVPGVRSRRPIVVVTGRSDAELDTAIAKLGVVAPVGSAPGLNALEGANGHQINAAGQSLSFSDLGIEKRELVGHTLRMGFDAGLPADFLPADYGRVSVDLAGGYVAGLGRDAQIIVEINGNCPPDIYPDSR
jgi:hypothetical protein